MAGRRVLHEGEIAQAREKLPGFEGASLAHAVDALCKNLDCERAYGESMRARAVEAENKLRAR